jgi:SAM-dependent methyltransferase
MAKIEYLHEASEHFPAFPEVIEVRPWALCGRPDQPFYVGSGVNFDASGTLWLEILYSVEGAQIFYTRTFLMHDISALGDAAAQHARLDELSAKGEGTFGFGDMMPQTCIILKVEKHTYPEEYNLEIEGYTRVQLTISADAGVVFGRSSPGERSVDIVLNDLELEDGIRFMRDLVDEVAALHQGRHPDPAGFPPGSSEWPFISQLNRTAYDRISTHYAEAYFDNPRLAQAFDAWLTQLPPGACVLDAGCGHGDPVIDRLLQGGFQVTGSDFSPEMLRLAASKFPQAQYLHTTISAIDTQAAFDGVCSFNALLYLDPIDLLNGIYRLHQALRPEGLLFLYAYDLAPSWRGEVFGHRLGSWMWGSHYGMQEAADLLQEHGYFTVLDACKVVEDPKEEKRIAKELKKRKKEEEAYRKRQEKDPDVFALPFFGTPIELSPYAYVILARRRS